MFAFEIATNTNAIFSRKLFFIKHLNNKIMYAKIERKGSMDRTKVYTENASVADTNSECWDGTDNGMNDNISSVTTGEGTWLWLFQGTNFNKTEDSLLVGPNQSNYSLAAHGFDHKLGSFQVCDHDPTLVTTAPPTTDYRPYRELDSNAIKIDKRYLLFVKNETTGNKFQPLVFLNNSLTTDNNIYNSSNFPTTQTVQSGLSRSYQWQFFEVTSGNYVIANCNSGKLLYKTNNIIEGDSMPITLGTNTDMCGIFSLTEFQESAESETWSESIAIRDITGPGNGFLTFDQNGLCEKVGDSYSNSEWFLLEYSGFELPHLEGENVLTLPSFNNDRTAPPLFPVEPQTTNSALVPYFMANDKTMRNWGDRIKHSPYYLIVQKSQYKLGASIMNNSTVSDMFIENWTYGWSLGISSQISGELGFTLGDTFSIGFLTLVRNNVQVGINAKLGLSFSGQATGNGSYSKDIRINVEPGTSVAFYGIETYYELYQMNGISCVARPNAPMRMDNNFLTISCPIS